MQIYKNRYQAEKAKRTDPWYSSVDVVVKVWGGYAIMARADYDVWRKQK